MILCRVTGTVVATRKDETLRPAKLLVIRPVDTLGNTVGNKDMLALDPRFGAGVGDFVLAAREGAVAAQLMGTAEAPTAVPANVVILGVVDDWTVQ